MSTPVTTKPIRFRLPACFLRDASPIMDDAAGYEPTPGREDSYLAAWKDVLPAIESPVRVTRDGSTIVDVTPAQLAVIHAEASYRAAFAQERAEDAYDATERLEMVTLRRSHQATMKRAAEALTAAGWSQSATGWSQS